MKTIAKLLGELIQVAYGCKRHDVFVNYSPHVGIVSVCIYFDKWSTRNDANENHCVYLDEENAAQKLKALIGYIKHLSKEGNQ